MGSSAQATIFFGVEVVPESIPSDCYGPIDAILRRRLGEPLEDMSMEDYERREGMKKEILRELFNPEEVRLGYIDDPRWALAAPGTVQEFDWEQFGELSDESMAITRVSVDAHCALEAAQLALGVDPKDLKSGRWLVACYYG